MRRDILSAYNGAKKECGNENAISGLSLFAILILLKILIKKCGNGKSVAKGILPHSKLLKNMVTRKVWQRGTMPKNAIICLKSLRKNQKCGNETVYIYMCGYCHTCHTFHTSEMKKGETYREL